jgi:hypothetical protein
MGASAQIKTSMTDERAIYARVASESARGPLSKAGIGALVYTVSTKVFSTLLKTSNPRNSRRNVVPVETAI